MKNKTYEEFLESKKHTSIDYGIKPKWFPDKMFDFQKHGTEVSIKKGRWGNFWDTGLGKTIMELTIAYNYVLETNKPVLIITPLAVAEQHLREAEKFGIDDVEHTKDGKFTKKIILINYERLHYLKVEDFNCVILDESSILKNFDGAYKNKITSFLRKIKYRYLFTATVAPNSYEEFGTSSEALGYLGYMDMLTKFFKNNNNSIDPKHIGAKWYLKPHAENDFWQWINSWSTSIRMPSDLGYSNDGYILPKFHEIKTVVKNEKPLSKNGQMSMFNYPAVNFFEIKQEVRNTIEQRCIKAVEKSNKHDVSVYWCNLNDESKMLKELDKSAYEVTGQMNIDKKEEILNGFSLGHINKLITKPSITSFGLNWQHCNHFTHFPTYSYEQYYQLSRRFIRFGQLREVFGDLIISDGQVKILESLLAKSKQADKAFENLVKNTNKKFEIKEKQFKQNILKPNFI